MDPTFLFGPLDPANQFAMEGLNMAFVTELHREGLYIFFIDVMVEKNTETNQSHKTT